MSLFDRQRGARPVRVGTDQVWERLVEALREGLDDFPDSEAFQEPLTGLRTRELSAPEVFSRFFGSAAA